MARRCPGRPGPGDPSAPSHHAGVLRRLVPLLSAAAILAAEDGLVIEAPGAATSLEGGGVVTVAGQGFVARRGDWLLSGDALRWDQRGDSLWASGGLVLVLPGVRIHAARLGMRPGARTGEAWEVRAWVERGRLRLRLEAERVELLPDRLIFRGVVADAGHGGLMSLSCPRITIHLREHEAPERGAQAIARYVEGIEAVSPTLRAAGIPVLWLPYLYRDYLVDYPWSTLEAGSSDRLGLFARYRLGSDLPAMAGWRTRLVGRADRHLRAGNGFGLLGTWRHDGLGRGSALVHRMVRERVADPADQGREGGTRDVTAWDAEHYAAGGGWAAAARWTRLPDADPSQTLPAGRPPDERFRADHLREELEQRPFARQGASGAWVTRWLSFAAEGEARPNRDLVEGERMYAAEASLPRLGLVGPLALAGSLRGERLRQERLGNEAVRSAWTGRLAAVRWLGGLGFDAAGGVRGVGWSDVRLSGSEIPGTRTTGVGHAEAGVRLRFAASGEAWSATVVPRLGVEGLSPARGRGNPGFDFGDGVDRPDADRRYAVTGIDGEWRGGTALFTAEAWARWGLRPRDRAAVDVDGVERTSAALADIAFTARGSPHPDVEAVADGAWDGRLGRWTAFDARARWRILDRLDLLYGGAYVPPTTATAAAWLHRTGASLHLSRYRLDGWGELRPGGAAGRTVDLWHAGLARRMVDGVLTASVEGSRDPDSGREDLRVAVAVEFGGRDDAGRGAVLRAFGF